MEKRHFFETIAALILFPLCICTAVFAGKGFSNPTPKANADGYVLTLDSNNKPSGLTSSYQNSFTSNVQTSSKYPVSLTFVNAKSLDNGFAQLANHGKIYNFDSNSGHMTGINNVSFTGSGSLLFKPANYVSGKGGILGEISPVTINAGSSNVAVPACDYFELEAGDSGASITSLSLGYTCDVNAFSEALVDGTFTGTGGDGYIYKLVLDNGVATLDSLNKPSNTHVQGTVTVNSKTSSYLTLGGNTYYATAYDGHALSLSGSPACSSFNRVYNVEDFESYTASGTGYVSADAKYTTTGLRSQYYADYYTGSSSGEIGGSGWPIMTSTDNSTYNSSKGHNSSKVGIFKFSNGMSMRYISMNSLYGVKSIIGKGSTFSFWARGAYTNTSFNTNHASNTTMKAYAYYDSPLTPSNQGSVREVFDFTVQAGSTWQHFEFPLTTDRNYYGFGIFAQQSSGSTQYVPVDDFQIYTASPYAEYVAPVSVTGVSVSPNNLALVSGQTSTLTATISPSDATNKNVSWSSNATSVATVDSNGVVTAVSAGNATITVTTADGGHTATCTVTVRALLLGGTFYKQLTNKINLIIALGVQGQCDVLICNHSMVPTSYEYNSNTKQVTIVTTGTYNSYNLGTITATYNQSSNSLTNANCTGNASSMVSNLTIPYMGSGTDSKLFNCSDNTSTLQSRFKRRYQNENTGGTWSVDTGNADRLTQNSTEYVTNESSMKVRGYGGNSNRKVALNLQSDINNKTYKSFGFWVYNPSDTNIILALYIFKGSSLSSAVNFASATANAGVWTFCCSGISCSDFTVGTNTLYNFQIYLGNNATYLSYDEICFYI